MIEDFKASINYFTEFMCESIRAFQLSDELLEESKSVLAENDVLKSDLISSAGYHARYAFLTSSNALEAAANSLLLGMKIEKSLYDDLEKLGTILKFELFCALNAKLIDRSNNLYARIKDVIKCRNEFVHPKPQHVEVIESLNGGLDFSVKRTKTSDYPLYISLFETKHAKRAISDILSFISWIVFDICKYELTEGAFLIGNNAISISGDVEIAAQKHGFDLRPFGKLIA